jgi:hypothetical protein
VQVLSSSTALSYIFIPPPHFAIKKKKDSSVKPPERATKKKELRMRILTPKSQAFPPPHRDVNEKWERDKSKSKTDYYYFVCCCDDGISLVVNINYFFHLCVQKSLPFFH